MMSFIKCELRRARKTYRCEASEVLSGYRLEDLLDGSQEQDREFVNKVIRAMETRTIEKGSQYVYYWGKNEDGDFYVFRANVEADAVCLKLDLYSEG